MTSARSSRRARSQWPPAPCVEEEPQALSKELDGLSKLGAKPGVDGVHTRGVIDQYPILVSANSPPPPSTSPGSVPSVPGLGSVSSDESAGPTTPPAQEPILRNTVRFEMDDRPKRAPPSTASQPRGPPSRPLTQQQPTNELNTQRETQPPSHDRDSNFSRHRPPTQNTSHGPRGPSAPDRSGSRAPMHDKTYLQPPKSSIGRSNSARHAPSTTRPMPERFRREPSSGYLSDPATTYNRPPSHQPQAPVSTAPVSALPNGPTLAERIDEKLRQRQEQRDTGSMSDPEVRQIPTTMKHVKPNPLNIPLPPPPPAPAPAPAPALHPPLRGPQRGPQRVPTQRTQSEVPPASRARATSVTMPPTRSMSGSRHPSRPAPEVTGSSRILSTRRYITTAPQHGRPGPLSMPTNYRCRRLSRLVYAQRPHPSGHLSILHESNRTLPLPRLLHPQSVKASRTKDTMRLRQRMDPSRLGSDDKKATRQPRTPLPNDTPTTRHTPLSRPHRRRTILAPDLRPGDRRGPRRLPRLQQLRTQHPHLNAQPSGNLPTEPGPHRAGVRLRHFQSAVREIHRSPRRMRIPCRIGSLTHPPPGYARVP